MNLFELHENELKIAPKVHKDNDSEKATEFDKQVIGNLQRVT